MKARDYIAQVRTARKVGTAEVTIAETLLKDFMKEGLELAKKRARSEIANDEITTAVLRELDLKYRAVAHAVDYAPNAWKNLWAEKGVTW